MSSFLEMFLIYYTAEDAHEQAMLSKAIEALRETKEAKRLCAPQKLCQTVLPGIVLMYQSAKRTGATECQEMHLTSGEAEWIEMLPEATMEPCEDECGVYRVSITVI